MNIVRMQVKPSCLYPMITLNELDPKIISNTVETLKNEIMITPIKVMRYKGYFFVLEGIYDMLAANIIKKQSVPIEISDSFDTDLWEKAENIEEQLKSIGMNALYDFEEMGGFTYSEYPSLYKRGE